MRARAASRDRRGWSVRGERGTVARFMRRVLSVIGLVAVPFLATLVAGLYLLGGFRADDRAPPGPSSMPSAPSPAPPPVELASKEPTTQPRVEVPTIDAPVRVLVLAEIPTRRSFVNACLQAWEYAPKIAWQAWSTTPGGEGAPATHSRSLPALEKQPSAADLSDVDVLFVAAIDPATIPPEVSSRVACRRR